jgi:hypothetical protein
MVRRGTLDRAGLDDAVFEYENRLPISLRRVRQSQGWFQVNI